MRYFLSISSPSFRLSYNQYNPIMWKKIKTMYNHVPQTFQHVSHLALPKGLANCYNSQIHFTPKLQKLYYTQELQKYIRFLNRKDKIKVNDLRSFTQAVLTQYGAIHKLQNHPNFKDNLNFSITKGYKFTANQLSPFHGQVDYMVWLNPQHFVPILFFQEELNEIAGLSLAHATRALKCIARNDYKNSGYSIITTGQQWQMFKVYSNQNSQRSVVYQGRNRFRNILEDSEMIQTLFGVMDECLQTNREEVNVLKLAYEIIDEKKYMIQAGSKEEAEKASPMSKLLLKYFKKKEDSNSK